MHDLRSATNELSTWADRAPQNQRDYSKTSKNVDCQNMPGFRESIYLQKLADLNLIGYMKEFAYVNLTISPYLRSLPPFTRQSLYASRWKVLGLTSKADANQPQETWTWEGAQSDMQVFTICTK